jgi:hypothetical protein
MQKTSPQGNLAETGAPINASALEPAGSHESSPYREVTPDSGAQRTKRNLKTGICGKTPPSRTPGVHVGTRQSQLSRSQQLKPCPGKENFEDRRTFVISNQQIRFAR